MSRSMQQPLPPMPLDKVDGPRRDDLNKVELPLDAAKEAIGRVVTRMLRLTDSSLKDLGDKGQVGRWTNGQENPNLARIWSRPETRQAFVIALAEESGLATVSTSIHFEDIRRRSA